MNIIRVGTTTVGNIILVTTDNGATVYATNGSKTISGIAVDGVAKLKAKAGTWRVWAELNGDTTSEVEVVVTDSYNMEMSFGLPLSSLAEGALVRLNESGSGVNFYLAKHNYESGLNGSGRSLLVRKDIHSTGKWVQSQNTYESSVIDTWFNGTYKALLDSSVQGMLGSTAFYYTKSGNPKKVTTLSRSIFTLSVAETGQTDKYANVEGSALPIASTLRIAYLNGVATQWWTRSIDKTAGDYEYVERIGADGVPGSMSKSHTLGYRPCFTLPATAMVSAKPNADGSYTLIV